MGRGLMAEVKGIQRQEGSWEFFWGPLGGSLRLASEPPSSCVPPALVSVTGGRPNGNDAWGRPETGWWL